MAGIDERIVEMTFKGASFASGVSNTISLLGRLKSSLSNLKGGEKDINSLDDAGKRFSLSGMAQGIDNISHHFSLMRIAGLTAFTAIVRQGLFAGEQILKSLTIDPIKAGLDVYETKINAIKTILANTQSEGTNLKQVTAALNQLNTYANQTVFNFGEMAKNIGTFTAAGVNLKTSVASIKGIANLAALSGSTSEQASTAMYQLSQAIAAGTVKLQDWNSVVNAGLGGKVFQNALETTARATGVNIDAIIAKAGSFRQSLQSGWLTSKILTQTLETFTGDLSRQQLLALGYTQKETTAILKQAAAAVSSATQIRTISQLFQALKEEVATAFSRVFEALLGNINEATSTFTSLHNVAEKALTAPINDLANMLEQFRKLGGMDLVIQGIKEGFNALGQVLHAVGAAFRTVFPSDGGSAAQGLIKIAIAFQNLMERLTPSSKTLGEIKSVFTGLFSVLKIGIDVVAAIAKGLGVMFGAAAGGGGGFLALAAKIGDFINNVRKAIESGNGLTKFFEGLGKVLSIPIKAFGLLAGALANVPDAIAHLMTAISPITDKIRQIFSKLTDAIGQGIASGNFQKLATLINTLLGGSILLAIRKFITNIGKGGGGGGLFKSITEGFESLTKTLEVMQTALKSDILKKIAIAVALLAGSLLVLSLIKPGDLAKAMAAMTAMFIQLGVALKVITGVAASVGIVKMAAVGVALNLLATAIVILAGAVAILAQFSWSQLARGLGTITGLLAALVATSQVLEKNAPGLILTSTAMAIMAVAIDILAIAVAKLGKLDFGTLAKGIGSVAILLAVLAGFNAISGAQLVGTAAAMLVLSGALLVLTQVVSNLGSMSIGTLAKGLIGMAAALAIIVAAMLVMPSALPGAVALVIIAGGLVILAQALQTMGAQSWESIAKSLVDLTLALTILAAAMLLMVEGLPGAAALLVMAGALAILAPVLVLLGSQSWVTIVTGLAALAGVFVILAAAGILLTPLAPTLILLGAAIALIGIGVAAAGVGVLAFAIGLTALGVALTAFGAGIQSFIVSILGIIPEAFATLAKGVVAFVTGIGDSAAAIAGAIVKLASALLDGITKIAPKAGAAFDAVMTAILGAINRNTGRVTSTFVNMLITMLNQVANRLPQFINAGVRVIVSFLNGVARNIGSIIRAGANLVISFINGISSNMLRITQAGINAIIHFMNGLASQIRASSGQMRAAAGNIGSAIVDGLTGGLFSAAGRAISAAASLGARVIGALGKAVKFFSPSHLAWDIGEGVVQGLALGMTDNTNLAEAHAASTGRAVIATLSSALAQTNNLMEFTPTITPVVDLSVAKKGFDDLAALTQNQVLTANISGTFAASIAAAGTGLQSVQPPEVSKTTNLTFNQTNTSPKNLSSVDIYRQTRNQLSVAKGALSANSS